MKSQLMMLLLVSSMAGIAGLSQTTGDLQKKYGPPDASGRYIVRPGIGLTVWVNETGIVREMIVAPMNPATDSTRESSEKSPVMKPDVAQAILSEIAPVSRRGRYRGTGNAEFGCTSVDHLQYENTIISISNRCAQQGGGTYSVRVHWKN
jgi:hypothetical protein